MGMMPHYGFKPFDFNPVLPQFAVRLPPPLQGTVTRFVGAAVTTNLSEIPSG